MIAAAITVIAGAPGWLEAILLAFLVVTGILEPVRGAKAPPGT
jgi:hypothetical protein